MASIRCDRSDVMTQAGDDASEREAVARAQRDPRAFAALYRAHYDAIGGYLYRRTGDAHATEDLLSEVFLKALQSLSRYRSRGVPFRFWLLRIATNAANRSAARFPFARSGVELPEVTLDRCRSEVLAFVDQHEGDAEACAALMSAFLERRNSDPDEQRAICERMKESWPRAHGTRDAGRHLAILKHLGRPVQAEMSSLDGDRVTVGHPGPTPVIVHLWDPGIEDEDRAVASVVDSRERHPSLAIISVVERAATKDHDAIRRKAEALAVSWPIALDLSEKLEEGFGWRLGVTRTGAFLRLDEEGRLAAVAYTREALVDAEVRGREPAAAPAEVPGGPVDR